MSGTKVAGQVSFSGAVIRGDLNLQNTEIGGVLFCTPQDDKHDLCTEVRGNVNLSQCRISSAQLDGRICANGRVSLALAQVGKLDFHACLPAKVDTEGLRFQQLTLPNDDYLGLLEATEPFQKSTYVFVENWLRNRGEDKMADRVYLAMRRRDRQKGMRFFARLGDWFLGITIGYGIKSYRLFFFYFLPVLVATYLLFRDPQAVEPNRGVVGAPAAEETWSAGDAFWMALQINLPLVEVIATEKWLPSSRPVALFGRTLPLRYSDYASTFSLLSWIAVPLFLAGISGLVKRKQ